ncbi:hypothetical protein BKI52_28745 [marine bacterium AO1-C]|nr:hypothetical protein BKI52_28745 [marine bacterium AO1-C]
MKTYIHNNPKLPSTPEVMLNYVTGVCNISGHSYMEDSFGFYQPIIEWIEQYTQRAKGALKWHISLGYFNSGTKGMLCKMFKRLKVYQDSQGGEVSIHWYYQRQDDDDLLDDIESLMELSQIEIHLHEFFVE